MNPERDRRKATLVPHHSVGAKGTEEEAVERHRDCDVGAQAEAQASGAPNSKLEQNDPPPYCTSGFDIDDEARYSMLYENPSTVSEDTNDAFVDANLALMRELDSLADALQSLPAGFKEKIDQQREKLARKLETRLKDVKEGMKRAPFIKTRDKFSFVAGVTNVALMFFMLGRHPEWLPIYFTIKFLLLLSIRWYIWKEKKYHYFLFDFCYYANLLILAYVNFFPKSETLFAICFAFCTGPLAWSILAWRNSLVFHSLDKTTSLFIHLTPNLLFYALRWLDKHPERYIDYDSLKNVLSILTQTMRSVARYETFRDNNDISFSTMILTPIVPYLLWQAFYFIKVQVISAKKVEEQDYQTTFRWFSNMDKGFIGRLIKKASPSWRVVAFMGYQLLYTIITMLPSILYLRYFWLHTLLIVGMCILSAWNGANYYFEIFSTRYMESLEKGTERIARLRRGSLALHAAISTANKEQDMKEASRRFNCNRRFSVPPTLAPRYPGSQSADLAC